MICAQGRTAANRDLNRISVKWVSICKWRVHSSAQNAQLIRPTCAAYGTEVAMGGGHIHGGPKKEIDNQIVNK